MSAGKNMLDAADILRPLPLPGIERSGQQEFPSRMTPGRFQEQLVKLLLPVGRVSSHIAQITDEFAPGFDAHVNIRVYATIKRPRHVHCKMMLKIIQYPAAGKRK